MSALWIAVNKAKKGRFEIKKEIFTTLFSIMCFVVSAMTCTTECYANTSYAGALVLDSGVTDTDAVLNDFNSIISPNATDTNLFTGAMSHRIPISVPPGRKGMEPSLALTYRSNSGNGWTGMGWDLNIDAIERNARRGINYTGDEHVLRKSGSASELINIGGNGYRAKIEGAFNRIEKLTAPDSKPYWVVTDKNGTQYRFGYTAISRQDSPAGDIFKWCLDQVIDTNGNYMTISYSKPPGQGEIYPLQISYNGHSVNFYFEGRNDAHELYSLNFPVTTAYRLKTIYITASGYGGVRTYKLNYRDSSSTGRSLLQSVVLYDKDANVDPSGNILNQGAIKFYP